MFQIYRELYFGKSNSVSSVYLWDKEEGEGDISAGFAGCFLIQNKVDDDNSWNSIHVVDVGKLQKGNCQYKLTSTLLLSITPSEEEVQSTNISGSLIRHNVRECKVEDDSGHIINIGKFIEDMESEMRSAFGELYIKKTKNIVEMIRQEGPRDKTEGQEHTKVLNEAVLAMALNRKAKLDDK